MKKVFATFVVATLILAAPILAQELGEVKSVDTQIKSIIHLGKGLAISTSDPKDFSTVKLGLGSVVFRNGTVNKTMTSGVMFVDEQKYKVRNITIGEGVLSGKLYLNTTEVGSFSVAESQKGERDVWTGTLELNGKSYNLYVIELKRDFKPAELREKVADYCRENKGDVNCREKIHEYCQNNPDDNRCISLAKSFCKDLTGDARCKQRMMKQRGRGER